MAESEYSESRLHGASESNGRDFEGLLAFYLGRLNDGEALDADQILADHPTMGEEILEGLEAFLHVAEPRDTDGPLGTLGDYTLRRQIGRGGMGVVYEAWQVSLDRQVALKVLPPGIAADTKAFTRFMREAKTTAQLNHPNVVGVHSVGLEKDTPYYAMEYVEGETLGQVLARVKEPGTHTPFGPKDDEVYFVKVARAFADVADGLQHAHSKRVIHRDIKPSNLILDGDGKLRILDFGLARLEGQESLTLSGDLMGTVLYMSPEQAMAKRIPLDHRTDVYSLGATMYEVLTGQPPFKGKDQHDTLSQIIVREPRPPRQLNPTAPRDFETIVLKCLRKDPAVRYGTAEALAQDLRRLVRGEVIEARPQTGLERLASRVRRHRAKFGLGAMFLVLVVSILWLAYAKRQADYEALRSSYEPSVLELVKQIYARQYSLQAVGGQLDGLFFGSSLTRMTADEVRTLWRDRDVHPVEEAAEKLAGIAEVVSKPDAHYFLAKACFLLGRADEARRRLRKTLERHPDFLPAAIFASELARPGGSASEFETTSPENGPASEWRRAWLEAHESVKAKDWPRAADAYGKLIALWERGEDPYIGAAIEAHVGRGVAYLEREEYDRARLDFHAARTLAPGFVEATLLMGKAYYLDEKPEAAEELFGELYDGAPDAEKNEVALWITGVYYSLQDHEKGLSWANRFGREGPIKERLRGYFLFFDGQTLEAIEAARSVIELNEQDPVAHLLLASGLSRNLDRPEGLDGLRKLLEFFRVARAAVELNPKNAFAESLLAQATVKTEHFVGTEVIDTLSRTRALSGVFSFLLGLGAVEAQDGFWTGERRLGPAINGLHTASGPCVSADGKRLIFRIRTGGGQDLAMATRPSKSEEFGDVKDLSYLNTPGSEFAPSLSGDGSRLYFARQPLGFTLKVGADIFVADWLPDEETFGRPVRVRGRVSTDAIEYSPVVSSDELTLYFARGRRAAPLDLNLYVATRASKDEPFDAVRALPRFDTEDHEGPSCLSSDGMTLFFTRTDWMTYSRGWMASRESPDGPFGDPVPVPGSVNEGELVHDHFVSDDWPASGSSLYFTRCLSIGQWGTQGCAIFQATWHLDCNGNGSDDAEEIERGEARDVNSNGIPDECEGESESPRAIAPR